MVLDPDTPAVHQMQNSVSEDRLLSSWISSFGLSVPSEACLAARYIFAKGLLAGITYAILDRPLLASEIPTFARP